MKSKKTIALWAGLASLLLPVGSFATLVDYGTTNRSNGKHLAREIGTENFHLTFVSPSGEVKYAFSNDGGQTWGTPEVVAPLGGQPTIGLAFLPWMDFPTPCLSYVVGGIGQVYYTWRDPYTGQWAPPFLIFQGYEHVHDPSLIVVGDTVFVAFVNYYIELPFQNNSSVEVRWFPFNLQNPAQIQGFTLDEAFASLYNPSLGFDGNGGVHAVWENGEQSWDVFYRFRPWQGTWGAIENVSNTPEVSEHCFIDVYGDSAFVVWSERYPEFASEVILRKQWLPFHFWLDLQNVSQTPSVNSEYPVSAWGEFTVWAEDQGGGGGADFDVLYESRTWGRGVVAASSYRDYFPHALMRGVPETFWLNLYTAWTESNPFGDEVHFDRQIMGFGDASKSPFSYYQVDVGKAQPSPYCLRRDGVKQYDTLKLDYGIQELTYQLPYLDPAYDYYLKGVTYAEGGSNRICQIIVDGDTIGAFTFIPNRIETLNVTLPKGYYRIDRKAVVTIRNVQGPFAALGPARVYRVEPQLKKGGGPALASPISKVESRPVIQVFPNPAKEGFSVQFDSRLSRGVSLGLYDISGRLVSDLTPEIRSAGLTGTIPSWKFRDKLAHLPGGVYFLRLTTEKESATQKVIIAR